MSVNVIRAIHHERSNELLTNLVTYSLVRQTVGCCLAEENYFPFPTLREPQTFVVDLMCQLSRWC